MPSRATARAVAEVMDRERTRLENAGLRGVAPIGRDMLVASQRAYRAGASPEQVAAAGRRVLEKRLPEQLADGMLASHLYAKRRTLEVASIARRADSRTRRRLDASVFTDALRFVTERLELEPAQTRALVDRYSAQAATATGEVGTVLEQKVTRAVREAVAQGLPTREGTVLIRDAYAAAGVTPQSPHLFETVYRTELQKAYGAGRWATNQDPAVADILWGFEYVTVGDDRVRPTHEALDGMVLPKDDPRWRELWPPNGYNCRCSTVEVFRDDDLASPVPPPETVEVEGVTYAVGADAGFDFNAGLVFGDVSRAA